MPRHLKSPVPAAQVSAARADVAERVHAILDDIRFYAVTTRSVSTPSSSTSGAPSRSA